MTGGRWLADAVVGGRETKGSWWVEIPRWVGEETLNGLVTAPSSELSCPKIKRQNVHLHRPDKIHGRGAAGSSAASASASTSAWAAAPASATAFASDSAASAFSQWFMVCEKM